MLSVKAQPVSSMIERLMILRLADLLSLIHSVPLPSRNQCLQVSWLENKGTMVLSGSYDISVKMMGDMGFLTSLLNFAKEQINDETVELLQPYFVAPDFNYESARKASGNVAGLCNWAAAMCKYHEVAKVVEPKIAALRAAEAELKVRHAGHTIRLLILLAEAYCQLCSLPLTAHGVDADLCCTCVWGGSV
jgi:hypothetical protein